MNSLLTKHVYQQKPGQEDCAVIVEENEHLEIVCKMLMVRNLVGNNLSIIRCSLGISSY